MLYVLFAIVGLLVGGQCVSAPADRPSKVDGE